MSCLVPTSPRNSPPGEKRGSAYESTQRHSPSARRLCCSALKGVCPFNARWNAETKSGVSSAWTSNSHPSRSTWSDVSPQKFRYARLMKRVPPVRPLLNAALRALNNVGALLDTESHEGFQNGECSHINRRK